MADQALRPLPGASTTLHRADVLRTHIDNILSIGEIQAPRPRASPGNCRLARASRRPLVTPPDSLDGKPWPSSRSRRPSRNVTIRSRHQLHIAESALENRQVQASRTAPISAIPVRSPSQAGRVRLLRRSNSCWQGGGSGFTGIWRSASYLRRHFIRRSFSTPAILRSESQDTVGGRCQIAILAGVFEPNIRRTRMTTLPLAGPATTADRLDPMPEPRLLSRQSRSAIRDRPQGAAKPAGGQPLALTAAAAAR